MSRDLLVQLGQEYFISLVENSTPYFDNEERDNGISEKYTCGRKGDGALSGEITGKDVLEMITYAVKERMGCDTLVMHPRIFARLLRDAAFQPVLLGGIMLVPAQLMPYDFEHDTSAVVFCCSYAPHIALSAKSVKVLP